MSFRLFKGHAPKKSAISRTAEREFEREVKKIESLDDNVKKLYKNSKRCTESIQAKSKCEEKIAQGLQASALLKEDENFKAIAGDWYSATQHLDVLSSDQAATLQKVMMEPMKKMGSVFPSVQNSTKKREQSLQEYNKCQAKLDKYIDKERTGPTIVKLDASKKALAAAKDDYDSHNNSLMEDMPKFYEGRIDYIAPSFQALIKSQVKYYTEAHKTYSDLAQRMQKQTGHQEDTVDEFDCRIQQKFDQIRALSITVDG